MRFYIVKVRKIENSFICKYSQELRLHRHQGPGTPWLQDGYSEKLSSQPTAPQPKPLRRSPAAQVASQWRW